jgi:lipid-A-disaccharide synthase
MAEGKCIGIVAGEISGDNHGAKLVHALRDMRSGLIFCGIGGPALREAGMRILVEASEVSVVGITEVLAKLPGIVQGMLRMKRFLKRERPDLLILIDFPDFNLRLAAVAKNLGIPVLYYVSPQIWAWRRGRIKQIKRFVDHMAVILPFEETFYRDQHVPVTCVGHPLLDSNLLPTGRPEAASRGNPPTISLVPGSRDAEVTRHLPVMLEAAHLLDDRFEQMQFVLSHAPSVKCEQVQTICRRHGDGLNLEIVSGRIEPVLVKSDLIVAASGTVTLQAAIHGTPMVIVYKVSPVSYRLGKALIRVDRIGLVNLVAGRDLAPELIQHDASGPRIAAVVAEMLGDRQRLTRLRHELREVRNTLGGPGASRRVAEIALNMLDG